MQGSVKDGAVIVVNGVNGLLLFLKRMFKTWQRKQTTYYKTSANFFWINCFNFNYADMIAILI
ncbi:MAG: hypothetical protein ABI723_07485 [Bacteroidia bacterium]